MDSISIESSDEGLIHNDENRECQIRNDNNEINIEVKEFKEIKENKENGEGNDNLTILLRDMAVSKQIHIRLRSNPYIFKQRLLRYIIHLLICVIGLLAWSIYQVSQNNAFNEKINKAAAPYRKGNVCETASMFSVMSIHLWLMFVAALILTGHMCIAKYIHHVGIMQYNDDEYVNYQYKMLFYLTSVNIISIVFLALLMITWYYLATYVMTNHKISACQNAITPQIIVACNLQMLNLAINAVLVFSLK